MTEPASRRGLLAGASFFGIGRGFGKPAAAAPVAPVVDPGDTQGDPVPPPATPATPASPPHQQFRDNLQQVINDDRVDNPDEMSGDDDVAQARVRERARCAAIMGCAAAADRVNYAAHLAFNTNQTRQEAISLLAAAPKEAKTGLAAAMAGHAHQRPGHDAPAGNGDPQAAVDASWDNAAKSINGGPNARRH